MARFRQHLSGNVLASKFRFWHQRVAKASWGLGTQFISSMLAASLQPGVRLQPTNFIVRLLGKHPQPQALLPRQ